MQYEVKDGGKEYRQFMHITVHDYVYVIDRYANGLLLIMFRYHSRNQYHIEVPFIRLLEMVLICPSF